jgi:Tectonin domain
VTKLLIPFLLVVGLTARSAPVDAFQPTDRIVCGTDGKDQIWCTTYGKELGKWERIPGSLRQVIVREGQLWGVSSAGDIYYAADISNPKWVHLQGQAKQIAVGQGVLCIVNDRNELWCADKGITTPKPDWRKASDGATLQFVSVN